MIRLALAGAGLALGVSLCGCLDDAQVRPAAEPSSGSDANPAVVWVRVPPPEPRSASCKFGEPDVCEAQCREGEAASCNNFAAMLELGRDVAVDRPRALTYYKAACLIGGSEIACHNLKRLLVEGVKSPDATAPEKTAAPAPTEPDAAERPPAPPAEIAAAAASPPAPSDGSKPACTATGDCQARCDKGDEASCDALPGVHIRGNVHISGNVKIFGNVYLHSH
jgi:hypothetical protein